MKVKEVDHSVYYSRPRWTDHNIREDQWFLRVAFEDKILRNYHNSTNIWNVEKISMFIEKWLLILTKFGSFILFTQCDSRH